MKQVPFNVDNIILMQDVWCFIKRYFSLPYDDVTRIRFHHKSVKNREGHSLDIERVNVKESIVITSVESEAFVIELLKEFNLDWRSVTSLSFDIDADSIPIFVMEIYPFVNRRGEG